LNKVFGETEVGGTAILYISDIDLAFLGNNPHLGDKPLPALSWAALTKVPPLIIGMGSLMAGIYWVTGRRMKLASLAEEQPSTPIPTPTTPEEKKNEK
jgi:formate dehydrogenase iron-sulfur subunit